MRYAKFIAAIVTAALVAAQTAVPMSAAAHGWVTVALSRPRRDRGLRGRERHATRTGAHAP